MGRKGESITLSLKDYEKKFLEELAREYGMMWGDRPNISKLLKAIAQRKLLVVANHDWSQERIKILNEIRGILVDLDKIEEAKLIAQILCDRSEINDPLRNEIEQFLYQPLPAWRQKIDSFIKREQPFRLIYQDAGDRIWKYTVLYARVELLERRLYLLCRCEETEGNLDVEGLQQNWILRLDRIKEAETIEIDRSWESDLQQIPVEFHCFNRLVSNYESKPEDISTNFQTTDKGKVYKKVVRNVYSTFWFFREIIRYGCDCKIVSPSKVQLKFKRDILQKLNDKYL